MDILRNLFGNLTSGIIRLAVTAGILFCAYLFIVKPVLHTSEEAFHSSGLDQIGKTLNTVNVQVQRQIRRSFKVTKSQGRQPAAADPLRQARPPGRRANRTLHSGVSERQAAALAEVSRA